MSTGSATSDSHDFSNYKTMGPNYQPSWNPEFKQPFKKITNRKLSFSFKCELQKKTPSQLQVPIHPYSSSPPCWDRPPGRKFVGIQRLICWYPVPGHPLRLPTKCLAHAPSFRLIYKGFDFFKGWKWKIYRLTIVQSGFLWFGGCFWKTGLGWVKSHASMS